MDDSQEKISRGQALKGLIVLPALAAAMVGSIGTAQAKSSKATLKYQDKPKNGQKCSDCRFYLKPKNAKAKAGCQLLDGSVSPNGWCVAYAKK
ncbi:MAG: high-potential iron-sulfur protein [Candidatus Eremiobacteraeota bacterium]|nr:high-potential iron-sulfur protein [Candidatus Eremiobacteraeota bacterium]